MLSWWATRAGREKRGASWRLSRRVPRAVHNPLRPPLEVLKPPQSPEAAESEVAAPLMAQAGKFYLKRSQIGRRREGSLAAALVQSMALAVITTAGAYPSWVLVTSPKHQLVLGAAWAIHRADPPWDSPLLGPSGGNLLLGIATCCLLTVVTASSAITWDFLGPRKWRRLGPALHCATAFLIACAATLGSSLFAVVRDRARSEPELERLNFTATPGQSLFLSFLASALAATATGLSCSSPALVSTSRSSRDLGRPRGRRFSVEEAEPPAPAPRYFSWQDELFFDPRDYEPSCSPGQGEEERPGLRDWYTYLKRELTQSRTSWVDRWWGRLTPRRRHQQQQEEPALGEEEYPGQLREPAAQEEEDSAGEKPWEAKPLPHRATQRELSQARFMEEDAVLHTRQPGEKEADQEDPGRGDAELQLSLAVECQRVKSGEKTSLTSENQMAEAGLVESQDKEKQDTAAITI